MNLNKTLAALMVASMSLLVAPMATANHPGSVCATLGYTADTTDDAIVLIGDDSSDQKQVGKEKCDTSATIGPLGENDQRIINFQAFGVDADGAASIQVYRLSALGDVLVFESPIPATAAGFVVLSGTPDGSSYRMEVTGPEDDGTGPLPNTVTYAVWE